MTVKLIIILISLITMTGCNLDQARPLSKLKETESLVVAWVDSGNLIVWRQGEETPRRIASGGVIRPYVSPDGERIAYTRGPNGQAETLWLVDTVGTTEFQVVGDDNPRIFRNGGAQVGDVAWFDETTLYMNTYSKRGFGLHFNDDLYRVNARTREVSLILPTGEGGRFAISPDNTQIATVSAGTYNRQDARISVVDPLAIDGATNLLFYIGVATGSETVFHPRIQWAEDSQSILVAIPDADLIYSETDSEANVPPTRLWQLPVNTPSDRNLLGSVRGSFFGLPTWSDTDAQMLYLRRTPQSNEFTVVIADANGDNPIDYLTGESGEIELPQWLPNSNRFIYTAENLGNVMIGQRGTDSELLSQEVVYAPQFITDDLYIFVTSQAIATNGFQLRFAQLNQQSVEIGNVGTSIPLFDAVLVTREVPE
jgi:Tol biopolymer transport system component